MRTRAWCPVLALACVVVFAGGVCAQDVVPKPAVFSPVPGTTVEDVEAWQALVHGAFFDVTRPRAERLATLAQLDRVDGVDVIPALLNVTREVGVTGWEERRLVGDALFWWRAKTTGTPSFGYGVSSEKADDALEVCRKTLESLATWWEGYRGSECERLAGLREKIERRALAGIEQYTMTRRAREFVHPSASARGLDERARFAHRVLFTDGFGLPVLRRFKSHADYEKVRNEGRGKLETSDAVFVTLALSDACRTVNMADADRVDAVSKAFIWWTEWTGGVFEVAIKSDDLSPAGVRERLAELERFTAWCETTLHDEKSRTAFRASVTVARAR